MTINKPKGQSTALIKTLTPEQEAQLLNIHHVQVVISKPVDLEFVTINYQYTVASFITGVAF